MNHRWDQQRKRACTRSLSAMLALCPAAMVPPAFAQSGEVKLTASDGEPASSFGGSVAIAGDIAVVGAAFDDDACPPDHPRPTSCNSGSAYVFRRVGSNWVEEHKLISSETRESQLFGWAVAVSGGTVMVSTILETTVLPSDGAVYVFEQEDGVWTERQKLLSSPSVFSGHFGISLAVEGDVAAVGQVSSATDAGAVYVFRRQGATWIQEQKLVPSDPWDYESFGVFVALSGNVIAVATPDRYAADVFRRVNGVWVQEERFFIPGLAAIGGPALALDGDYLMVGAPADSGGGGVEVFRYAAGAWQATQTLTSPDPQPGNFGSTVALHSGFALVAGGSALPGFSGGYLYQLRDNRWVLIRIVRSRGSGAMDDGLAITGAPFENDGTGAAYILQIPDCNGNGMDDESELAAGTSFDCNATGTPDECEIATGASRDCNQNGVPDECDLADETSLDCNENAVPDECDPQCTDDPGCLDCNGNGISDICDLNRGTSADCTRNRIPDECDLAACTGDPACADCNENGVPDGCEPDCDADGLPDACDAPCLGACCDHDPFHGCLDGLLEAQCTCPDCVWAPNTNCADIECPRDSIPAVSQWGLAVLALSLLIGAKLRFPGPCEAIQCLILLPQQCLYLSGALT